VNLLRYLGLAMIFATLFTRIDIVSVYPPSHWIQDTLTGIDKPYSKWNVYDYNAPYGVIWLGISRLLIIPQIVAPHLNESTSQVSADRVLSYWITSSIVDSLVTILIWSRKPWAVIPYGIVSTLHFFTAPWNLPVLWFTMLGLFTPWGLLLGLATKLPVGSYLMTGNLGPWQYALNMGQVWHRGLDSWQVYGSIGLLWLGVLAYNVIKLKKSRRSRLTEFHEKDSDDNSVGRPFTPACPDSPSFFSKRGRFTSNWGRHSLPESNSVKVQRGCATGQCERLERPGHRERQLERNDTDGLQRVTILHSLYSQQRKCWHFNQLL